MQDTNLLQIYWIAADNIKRKFHQRKCVPYVFFPIESPKVKITSASCTEEKKENKKVKGKKTGKVWQESG